MSRNVTLQHPLLLKMKNVRKKFESFISYKKGPSGGRDVVRIREREFQNICHDIKTCHQAMTDYAKNAVMNHQCKNVIYRNSERDSFPMFITLEGELKNIQRDVTKKMKKVGFNAWYRNRGSKRRNRSTIKDIDHKQLNGEKVVMESVW